MDNTNTLINNSSSLKEYYINIEKMMHNALNMINAINQSLSTSASEITVNLINADNTSSTVRIPSFIYLENKIEEVSNIISNLFELPKSGEAWFHNNSNMFKLSLVKSNVSPSTPKISNIENIGFNSKENNIFKDLVNPKTYIRLNIDNLTDNIEEIYMKKMVIYNSSDAEYLKSFSSYNDVKNALFNKKLGTDYEEYESVLKLPLKEDKYLSSFRIEELPNETDNPYYANSEYGGSLRYIVRLNTIEYTDKQDSSILYQLKKGDYLCLPNTYVVYKIVDIYDIENSDNINDMNDHIVVLEEYIGHVSLQTYSDNSDMVLSIYSNSYNKYHYVDIPLEENPNIIIFIGTIYNNVKSTLSDAIHLDLNTIYMKDDNGNNILDTSGNPISYMNYYKTYCKNIGDMMVGFTQLAYPQLSNYSSEELKRLTESEELKNMVTSTLYMNKELVVKVDRINSHLIEDDATENIIKLHEERNRLNTQLRTIQDNVDQIYSQLTTTDFSQESNITQESLKGQLNSYYDERLSVENQLLNIIDNIHQAKNTIKGISDSKYRIRGITDTSDRYDSSTESPIISFLHSTFGRTCDIIGLDVEYKYKSISKDTTSVSNSSNNIFTDWNKLSNIDRERYIKFDVDKNSYEIVFSNYNTTSNVIKWNQIDIPINQGEDVIIRIRYKYNIGQPFMNLYTPWSDEITVQFPVEYTETTEIKSILDTNQEDVNNSKFVRTLIKDGYQEHINNKIIDNSQVFYHMPENIYSGFNTNENKMISLKDKLTLMNNDLVEYKTTINNILNSNYKVYLEWENNSIELSNLTVNNIVINDVINGTSNSFIKKELNIIIKNEGNVPIKLYSIFPGEIDTLLLEADHTYYNQYYSTYDRVPLLIKGSSKLSDCVLGQHLGQWIYFRQTNPFTNESLYLDETYQKNSDMTSFNNGTYATFEGSLKDYIGKENKQVLLPYRKRIKSELDFLNNVGFLDMSNSNIEYYHNTTNDYNYNYFKDYYKYSNIDSLSNNYIMKFENLIMSNNDGSTSYMTKDDSINSINGFSGKLKDYNGAFFIPELYDKTQILCTTNKENQYYVLDSGKSVSIPLLFEYFLVSSNVSVETIKKTLAFDIKTSTVRDIEHYIISIEAKYDYTQSNATLQSYSLLNDSLSE